VDERYLQMYWVAENDPVKINELKRMPTIEYYALADHKIDVENKRIKAMSKASAK
jgi:hypothetical protein